ncbi:MAG: hypothetical protein Q7R33_07915 [Nitrosarchaeum sp.]|nr:hypothetical protein [Nitrosarchaeum sp.]
MPKENIVSRFNFVVNPDSRAVVVQPNQSVAMMQPPQQNETVLGPRVQCSVCGEIGGNCRHLRPEVTPSMDVMVGTNQMFRVGDLVEFNSEGQAIQSSPGHFTGIVREQTSGGQVRIQLNGQHIGSILSWEPSTREERPIANIGDINSDNFVPGNTTTESTMTQSSREMFTGQILETLRNFDQNHELPFSVDRVSVDADNMMHVDFNIQMPKPFMGVFALPVGSLDDKDEKKITKFQCLED